MADDFDSMDPDEVVAGNRVRAALRPDNGTGTPFSDTLGALAIDPSDLEQEFIQAPEILARFVEDYTQAEGVHLRAKFALEQTEAKLQMIWRERLIRRAHMAQKRERAAEEVRWQKTGDPRSKKQEIKLRLPTVVEIDAQVRISPEYANVRYEYIEAEVASKRAKGFCDAARVKRDMLTNVGMRHNAELRITPLTAANARHPAPPAKSPGAFDEH